VTEARLPAADWSHPSRTVAVTGAGGFLGSRVARAFGESGWAVRRLSSAGPAPDTVPFHLGEPLDESSLVGAHALVHCAYDFSPIRWEEVARVNVAGSSLLFSAASRAGVTTIVEISSISAFNGTRSRYGRAKLATEHQALAHGGVVVRPGLIWDDAGAEPGGMFGSLAATVGNDSVVPLVGGGSQLQHLVHVDDLTAMVVGLADGSIRPPREPITAASPRPQTMRDLLAGMAATQGRRPRFVPVPWRAVWLGLRACEAVHLPTGYRSDSVVSLVKQDRSPDFGVAERLGVRFRPYRLASAPRAGH